MMNNESIDDIFAQFAGGIFGQKLGYSEKDIISMYVDGRISKEEYIRRMSDVRRNKVR
jgi:hypothetical protein